jgi:hypothetical protein
MQLALIFGRFFGSWLLVFGPVYQAAIELTGQDVAFDRIRSLAKSVVPKKASAWWWLLPPVKMVLDRHYLNQAREQSLRTMGHGELAAFLAFSNKALGWMYVGGGGLLLAFCETQELVVRFSLGIAGWIGINVLLFTLCVMSTRFRIKRTGEFLSKGA